MSMYSKIRGVYHFVVPDRVRHGLYLATPRALLKLRRKIVTALEETGRHDEVYDAEYYAKFVEPTMKLSADAIATSICRDFAPGSVVDFGCGTGGLLAALRERGVRVRGFEYSAAALDVCRQRGLEVTKLDIESDPIPEARADVVVSTEVAEHLPASCADKFVELLTAVAPTVVLTAATPGQGGTDHVNEQPNEYWIAKFEKRGYAHDAARSGAWREEWKGRRVAGCYANTVMVLGREPGET